MARNTTATIDTGAIGHNLEVIRRRCPDSRIMAVVKADAYGHRLSLSLPALNQADMLAVATLGEAREVRALGNGQPVLLLEGFSHADELPVVDELGLETVVHHANQLAALERWRRPLAPRIWLKLDSGMHRLGFPLADAPELVDRLRQLPGVEQVNLMSHFACADMAEHPLTEIQLERFDRATEQLSGERTLANSAAILQWPASHRDWVRAGILVYGISPLPLGEASEFDLKPAMTLRTELIAVNRVPAGESIGYGARFVADRDMVVGTAAIGYGDGYPRNVPDGTPVLVNGRRTRVVGRVSMDMTTLDLTGMPEAKVGDPVVLWGEGLPIEEVARDCGTIPYELVCRVTRRVKYESG